MDSPTSRKTGGASARMARAMAPISPCRVVSATVTEPCVQNSGSCAMKSWGVHRSPGTSTVGNLPNTTGVLATGAGMGAPWDRSRY